jgi:PD-(D/E)XK nuclease superfamily
MPGIMFNMDNFEKRLVDAHFEEKGSLPKWLKALGCTEPVEFPAKLTEDIDDLDLTLVGMPDAVLRMKNGDLIVIDYKTAKSKGDDDPFMPAYEAQLWGYARLLESNGIGPVSGAALVYFENCLANYKDSPLDLLSDDGMRVPFTVKLHPVEIDLKALDGLLKKFRKYADMTGPLVDCDCKTCDRLQRLFAIDKRFRSRCREAVVRDMAFQDRLVVERVLSGQESRWRETLVAESHAWEADLNDLLASDSDCVPGPLDL